MARRRCSGDGKRYPSRLRLRRIVWFLKHQGFTAAARKIGNATCVYFDSDHMENLMRLGHWDEADSYLQGFLSPGSWSWHSQQLIVLLYKASILAVVAGGGPDAAETASIFDDQQCYLCPRIAECRKVLHKMHADQPRASMLWNKVAPDAVKSALKLVAICPELKDKLHCPHKIPWQVAPLIGARGSQRRCSSKTGYRTPAVVLSRSFLRLKRLHSVQEKNTYSGVPNNASPSYVAPNMETEQISPKPSILGGFPINAPSSYVALNKETEQIAPEPIFLREPQAKENVSQL